MLCMRIPLQKNALLCRLSRGKAKRLMHTLPPPKSTLCLISWWVFVSKSIQANTLCLPMNSSGQWHFQWPAYLSQLMQFHVSKRVSWGEGICGEYSKLLLVSQYIKLMGSFSQAEFYCIVICVLNMCCICLFNFYLGFCVYPVLNSSF